jgi:hypothetical protein
MYCTYGYVLGFTCRLSFLNMVYALGLNLLYV